MRVTCVECHCPYDDSERLTFCPHALIMPREDLDRKIAALKLAGKRVRFAHQQETGPDYGVESIGWNGFITLRGFGQGQFAPHEFVVMSEAD